MIPRTGLSSGSSTAPVHPVQQERPATTGQASPGRPEGLSNSRAPTGQGARHVPRPAKGKAVLSFTHAASSSALAPVGTGGGSAPVVRVRQCVDHLMTLRAQRKEVLQVALAARPGGPAVAVAGPSEADIVRLSKAFDRQVDKSAEQARDVQEAQRDLDKHESQLAKAMDALARLAGPADTAEPAAAQESLVRQGRSAQAQHRSPGAQAASPAPAATPSQASPLQEAKQQLAKAKGQLEAANSRFKKAKDTAQQRQQSARAWVAELRGRVERVGSRAGLLHGMRGKVGRDSNMCLTALGLPGLRNDDDKASLRQQFLTYRDGLTECRPGDGRWQFRAAVDPGLPKLMAFDALVRTHMYVAVESPLTGACKAYEGPLPDPNDPDPEYAWKVAREMAGAQIDLASATLNKLAAKKTIRLSGRQKVVKQVRRSGATAVEARTLHQLRMTDVAEVNANARLLQALLQDNRADLEVTLGNFIATGFAGVRSERARLAREAEAAQQQANQPDPNLAARMNEVIKARQLVMQAEAKVQEFGPEPRDLPRPATPAQRAAVVPQIQAALPGPGLARDPETRSIRQRGRILDLEAARDSARLRHGEACVAWLGTVAAQQKAREHLQAAWVAHAQARQAAQQDLAQQRLERGELGARLGELDRQIKQARADLRAAPALQSLIDPWALRRVIDVHVDPDDEALRQRALEETGLNGRYDSLEHMALAVADVHEAANRRFPLLFAARTPQEFEQAATQHPEYDAANKALVNIPHEHGCLVGQGYDAKPDRTSRLIPLTRSEYGLAWREGGVMITHLHPGVPRRTLKTLAPSFG